ncbi:RNA-binding protein [Sparassis crispa]|uniref:RNA-binding protein n=1 Tax=Sparassis crispa TaxID=139825 RepID=A0A401G758_9APHY|nr:RNA-binding protein [Sparassis crispa]GBE77987.1 RNA-binding protein [Sparassis crispa]
MKMSSPISKMDVDREKSLDQKSKSSRNLSTETLRTRRSHRSRSRDRDKERDKERRDRRRERDEPDERRKRSRSRDKRDRDRSREKYRERDRVHDRERERDRDKDRERRRERDGERHRGDRDSGESRHSHRDRDKDRDRERERDDRENRRRKRGDELEEGFDLRDAEERAKRKRRDDVPEESSLPAPPPSAGLPPPPPPLAESPRRRRDRSRDADRRFGDRPPRPPRDPRDEFDDVRYGGDREKEPERSLKASPLDDGPLDLPPERLSPTAVRRPSPSYELPPDDPMNDEFREDDSEARSVFVSQLAARLTARDLGYFFEDKLGEGTVMDSRIVTDRISRRSKGIGYVEFRSVELVDKAISLSGTVVMGLPIQIQHTEAERNKLHAGDGNLNLPPGVSAPHGGMQLYVGSLHFNLTESDIKQVFEPFGELEFVDLHRDPMTGRSKGYAFVQYKRAEDAKMALEQMEGFELAGRTLRVNTVHEKGTARYTQQDSLDEAGGGNLNAASRQALMQKLARIDQAPTRPEPIMKPNIPQAMQSRSVLLKNMFDPEEETERDWDKELAEDVKSECEGKYGHVEFIKVEKESQGEIYVKFDSIESAKNAVQGLNSRWFGGNQVSAAFISDAIMQAHQ